MRLEVTEFEAGAEGLMFAVCMPLPNHFATVSNGSTASMIFGGVTSLDQNAKNLEGLLAEQDLGVELEFTKAETSSA